MTMLLFSNILASFLIFIMEPHGTYWISVGMYLKTRVPRDQYNAHREWEGGGGPSRAYQKFWRSKFFHRCAVRMNHGNGPDVLPPWLCKQCTAIDNLPLNWLAQIQCSKAFNSMQLPVNWLQVIHTLMSPSSALSAGMVWMPFVSTVFDFTYRRSAAHCRCSVIQKFIQARSTWAHKHERII